MKAETVSGPNLEPWTNPAAVAALIDALDRAVPGDRPVRLIGAAADRWAARLGERAQLLPTSFAASPSTEAKPATGVVVVCSPDALPVDPDDEPAFVAALAGLGDVVVLATVSPAAAVDRPGRWPAYWVERFAVHGWRFVDALRGAVWHDSHVGPDVKEGALVFVAPTVEVTAADPPLALLHPHRQTQTLRSFEARLERFRQEWEAQRGAGPSTEVETQQALLRAVEARLAALDRRVDLVVDRAVDDGSGHEIARAVVGRLTGRGARPRPARPDPAVAALFDPYYYLQHSPETAPSPLAHYLEHGEAEGRRPNAWFDPAFYRRTNPDVVAAGMSALGHYAAFGGAEGRAASAEFDTAWYVAQHPEVRLSGLHPLVHFLAVGAPAGHAGTPVGGAVAGSGPVYAAALPSALPAAGRPSTTEPAGEADGAAVTDPTVEETVPTDPSRPLAGTYIGNGRVLICLRTGGRLLVSSDDLTLVGELIQDGIYDVPFTRFLQRTLRPDSVFVDVGANVGLFTVVAAHLAWDGRCVAYEAAPRTATLLRDNVAMNWLGGRVTVRPVAVGASAGTATFRFPATMHTLGALALDTDAFAVEFPGVAIEETTVDVVSLDDDLAAVAAENVIDLVKIDVEGGEPEVLRGMHGLLAAGRIRRLSLELRRDVHERNRSGEPWTIVEDELRRLAALDGRFARPDEQGELVPLTVTEVLEQARFSNLVVTFPADGYPVSRAV